MLNPNEGDMHQLCNTYLLLDDARADIDQRIIRLPPDAPDRDVLWLELETNLARQREVIERLAQTPATDTSELCAKAAVLAKLLRLRNTNASPIVSDDKSTALALALAEDISRLLC